MPYPAMLSGTGAGLARYLRSVHVGPAQTELMSVRQDPGAGRRGLRLAVFPSKDGFANGPE
jgi:hypothetical protein